jgi:AcrR family transcriptional regulator
VTSAARDRARPAGSRPRGRPGYDRDAVLQRAVGLFNRRGYDATSIGDLAADLGVTKSAIYHHFDSKESLLAAALDEALTELTRVVDTAEEADGDVDAYDRLTSAVRASVQILVAHLPAVTLLLRVRGNSELEERALRRRRHIDEQLARLVHAAVDEGALRDDIDAELISRLVFGTVNSLVDWVRPDGVLDAAALGETVVIVVFDGLRAGPGSR